MKQEDRVKVMEDIKKKKAVVIIGFMHDMLNEAKYKIIDVLYKNVEEEKEITDRLKEAYAIIDTVKDLLRTLEHETYIEKWL